MLRAGKGKGNKEKSIPYQYSVSKVLDNYLVSGGSPKGLIRTRIDPNWH